MRLSIIGYYSDFVIYPILIAALAAAGLGHGGWHSAPRWTAICLAFVAVWTLIEYTMHRFAFHHVPYIRDMHDHHHREERAFLGTPIWLSLPALVILGFLPIWLISGFWLASAAACGLTIGYLWYISVHHMLHHWHPAHSGYLYHLKRHHALHHYTDQERNFGVSTGVWDRVFGTLATQDTAAIRH